MKLTRAAGRVSDPAERPRWRYDDLMYHGEAGRITPERAFTIAQLMVYRLRDAKEVDPATREVLTELADAIVKVSKSWRS